MKPLTTSIYTFAKLIEGGFLYVDKTAGIQRLVQRPGQFFLARPRRFGKSLLVATLKALFQGRRELFAGLAIERLAFDWAVHPVIHLDLGSSQASTPEELEENLLAAIRRAAADHATQLSAARSYQAFEELVRALAARASVVILIDEYDKPLLGALGDAEQARALLPGLKRFYSVIKTTEAHQRFALLTGVSKFSKVSVFSDLNNLTDLTMSREAATLLGYTQEELEANFPDYLARLAQRERLEVPALLERIRSWYNGYRFHQDAETVYNPVSVGRCLAEEEFKNYWFETGTPTFLIELLKAKPVELSRLDRDLVAETSFSAYDVANRDPLPLLFQTGYLTIRDVETRGGERFYRLAYPNREIEQSFSRWLAEAYSAIPRHEVDGTLFHLLDALAAGDLDECFRLLRVFFANVPYTIQLNDEKYYQTIFFVVFRMLGTLVDAEVCTERGRVDAVVKTAGWVYVFEFKLHGTAAEALAQIRQRRYFEKYQGGERTVLLVGAAFDPETRNLERWLVEPA